MDNIRHKFPMCDTIAPKLVSHDLPRLTAMVLENRVLRQQVTMLLQSVKRPHATASWWQSSDSLSPSQTTTQPDALDDPSPAVHPNPFHHIITVEYVKFVGSN
jgi:hypothetical protein